MNRKEGNIYLNAGVLTPVGVIVILLIYVIDALRMSPIIHNGLPSESFFPFFIFVLGFPLAIYLLITGVIETKKSITEPEVQSPSHATEEEHEGRFIKVSHKPFYITVLTFAFIIVFRFLGYSLTAPIYLFLFQMIYDDEIGGFKKKIVVSLVVTALVYGLYVGCFNILFPEVWK